MGEKTRIGVCIVYIEPCGDGLKITVKSNNAVTRTLRSATPDAVQKFAFVKDAANAVADFLTEFEGSVDAD